MNPLPLFRALSAILLWCAGATLALPAVRYVNGAATGTADGLSWANAYPEVVMAINAAQSGDEIWIAKGIYYPDYDTGTQTHTANRDLRFVIKSGVPIYGGFAGTETLRAQRNWVVNRTILSGDIGTPGVATDNTRTLMATEGTTPVSNVVLEGLVLSCGRADNPAELGNGMVSGSGGAAYVRANSLEFRHCVFVGNYAVYGGAIYVASSTGAGVSVTGCLFAANSALYVGGAIDHQSYTGQFTVRQSTLVNNTGSRGSAIGTNTAVTCFYYNNLIHSNPATSTGWQTVETGTAPTAAGNVVQYALPNATAGGLVVANPKFAVQPSSGTDGRWGTMDDVLVASLAADSPALSAGVLVQTPVDLTDVDGDANTVEVVPMDILRNPRVRDGQVDAGAFAFVNTAPTALVLSASSVSENLPVDTTVGTLSATDAEGGTLTYALVDGEGATDNARFSITNGVLKTAESLDFETNPAPSVRVRASDSMGASVERVFILTVLDGYDPTVNDFEIGSSALAVVAVPGFNHTPVRRTLTPTLSGFDFSTLQVSSSASWVAASVDLATHELVLTFKTASLVSSSNQADITLVSGSVTRVLKITAAAVPLNIVRMVDDPTRSRTYAVQQNGTATGAVLVIDPLTNTPVADITVGGRPTDCDITADGKELIVICSATREIHAINLETLAVTEIIPLASFTNWDVTATSAHVAYGPPGILYYTDGAWAPLLRVMRRSGAIVVQTVGIDTVSPVLNSTYGFGDFAVSPDGKSLYGWAQYGWTAGWAGSYSSKFSIGSGGYLTHVAKGPSTYPTAMARDPLTTPALVSNDSSRVFMKQLGFSSSDIATPSATFAGPVYAISPGAEIVTTSSGIYERATGTKIYSFTPASSVQAITSDYARLVYFDATLRQIRTIDLNQVIGPAIMGRSVAPADGSVVLAPSELRWTPVPGVDLYDVYFGTSASAVETAAKTSPEYLGRATGPSFTLNSPLVAGTTYYWRINSVLGTSVSVGSVRSFTVSSIALSAGRIDTATVRGHSGHSVTLDLASAVAGRAWTVSSDASWISFDASAGTTPATLQVRFDTRALTAGRKTAVINLSSGDGVIGVPVVLQVDPLALNVMKSRPGTTKVYGLSEEGLTYSADGYRAYLLEIDTLFQRVTRVVPVGKGATDLAVHEADGRVYVTNWRSGKLLAVDLDSFGVARTYEMTPFAGIGYSRSDAYRLSAGGAGRLMFEAADQWIYVSLYDTVAGKVLSSIYEREGGGAYGQGKRYYYHGDNNSSGAELHKLDTTGDVFTPMNTVRVVGSSYYGSRSVQVSEDGGRVTWNGAVFDANLSVICTPNFEIYSVSADGRYAFGETKIYDTVDQLTLEDMPSASKVSVFNAATGRLVVQKNDAILFYTPAGGSQPGQTRFPADGSTVPPTGSLSWFGLPGATGYRVYLGTSADAVASAGQGSPEYLGQVGVARIDLAAALASGQRYYWRVDIVVNGEVAPGNVQTFWVSDLVAGVSSIDASTVQGFASMVREIPVTTTVDGASWSATTTTPWIRIVTMSGTAPGTVRLELDSTALAAGVYQGSVTLAGVGTSVVVPVTLRVDPLAITVMRSDPDSAMVYAVSEYTPSPSVGSTRAYLLEIDTALGRITRVVVAGSGATDLAVHPYDERIYVTNWTLGRLLAFDRDTLALVRTYEAFVPPGSSGTDAYRISAGGQGRLVVEGEDQWIYVSLFDTGVGKILASTFPREGGGAYDAAGRYYFHGDNNISNAALHRFDTTGDAWLDTQSIRVVNLSYYGSRNVVMAENGSRVFWNGSVFTTESFAEEWAIHDDIISASADGRVAFSHESIYDVANKAKVMSLVWHGTVVWGSQGPSAYNSVTDTFVYGAGGTVGVQPVGYLEALPVPVPVIANRTMDSVGLSWTAKGLYSGFSLEWRESGMEDWHPVLDEIPPTSSTFTVTQLPKAGTAYEFRLRALNPFQNSAWSEPVSGTTVKGVSLAELPAAIEVPAGTTLNYTLPLIEGVTYSIADLPAGLTFDPVLRVLGGSLSASGRYRITVVGTGDGVSSSAEIELVFESADVTVARANYAGLLSGDDGLLGSWRLSRTGTSFTAVVQTTAGTASIKGIFPATGVLRTTTVTGRMAKIALSALVSWDRVEDRISLSLNWNGRTLTTLDDTGYVQNWNGRTRPYSRAGTYNVLMRAAADAETVTPSGLGFLTLKINASGQVTLAGETALGQRISGSGAVSANQLILLHVKQGNSLLWGALTVDPTQTDFAVKGVMLWAYTPVASSAPYPAGFACLLDVAGSAYKPSSTFQYMGASGTSLQLTLSGGGLNRTVGYLSQTSTLTSGGLHLPSAGSTDNPNAFKVQLNPNTGLLTGSASVAEIDPKTSKRVVRQIEFRGLGLQNFDGTGMIYVGGYFVLPNWSGSPESDGSVELSPVGSNFSSSGGVTSGDTAGAISIVAPSQ